jgi:hypothetical protein
MQLGDFSSKLPALLESIDSLKEEKHYVYSAFYTKHGTGQGILEIANQLEKVHGYTKLTVAEAKKIVSGGTPASVAAAIKAMSDQKRYILAITSEIGEEGGKSLDYMIQIYNHAANVRGSKVHVFLASQTFNEGLDLKAVRHIHIFEPLVTMASDVQTIGRARRYCSHSDLAWPEWTVEIHRYLADLPAGMGSSADGLSPEEEVARLHSEINSLQAEIDAEGSSKPTTKSKANKKQITAAKKEIKRLEAVSVVAIDEHVYKVALNKMRDLFTIYNAMKSAAIDCGVLHKFHNASWSCKNDGVDDDDDDDDIVDADGVDVAADADVPLPLPTQNKKRGWFR